MHDLNYEVSKEFKRWHGLGDQQLIKTNKLSIGTIFMTQ